VDLYLEVDMVVMVMVMDITVGAINAAATGVDTTVITDITDL
jgi:hypothetical protein